jgi:hypothetical protein
VTAPAVPEERGTSHRGTEVPVVKEGDRGTQASDRYSGYKEPGKKPASTAPKSSPSPPWETPGEAVSSPYPAELGKFTAWLIRQGYIRKVTALLPATWRTMSEADLTVYLSSHFTEAQLAAKFEGLSAQRVAFKTMARRGAMLAAFAIGLIWARENVEHDEWEKAIAKIGGTTISAIVVNRLLYARDKAAAEIMERNALRFGKWFQGVARTNRILNRLLGVGMVSTAGAVGLSGGGEYPSIPFDIIYECDIDDPKTWLAPSQHMLDFGFTIWYRQKPTAAYPEARAGNMYLGTVYGSPVPILYGLIKTAFFPGEAY